MNDRKIRKVLYHDYPSVSNGPFVGRPCRQSPKCRDVVSFAVTVLGEDPVAYSDGTCARHLPYACRKRLGDGAVVVQDIAIRRRSHTDRKAVRDES